MKFWISWYGKYVCGEPVLNSGPELTLNRDEALTWPSAVAATTWLDGFFRAEELRGSPFYLAADDPHVFIVQESP